MAKLLVEDPQARAFVAELRGSRRDPHRIVLCHPFFWSSRTAMRFLATLGNYEYPPPFDRKLIAAADAAVQEVAPGKSWFSVVEDLEQADFPTDERQKNTPWSLLKFIRNKCVHMNDRRFNSDHRDLLKTSPFFLKCFPSLVKNCWEALLPELEAIMQQFEHAPLREFFDRPFEVDSVRDGDERSLEWL